MPTTRICRIGAERTHTPHAVMEAALAHVVRNKAEAAYARSDLFREAARPDGVLGDHLAA